MPSTRATLGALKRDARYRSLALAAFRHRRPVVAYVGWTGEGNLGDESMFAMHQSVLGLAVDLVPIPIVDNNVVLRTLAGRIDGICLGGGTLIANGFFRHGLEAVMTAAPSARRFMIGVGSESAAYSVGRRANIDQEFAKWRPLLAEFDQVRVRGPLSVQTLGGIGVSAVHTGDPALLLPRLPVDPVDGLVGLNVGITDDQWGGGHLPPADLLNSLIDTTLGMGASVRLLPTTEADFAFMTDVVRARPDQHLEMMTKMPSVPELLHAMAGCRTVIGMKLHALILAASQRVPVIAIEYRPKCRDFMATLGLEDVCFRTDDIDVPRIQRALDHHLERAGSLSAEIGASVDAQAKALREAAAVEVLGLAT